VLTFDASTHTYRWRGLRVPSVTQILQPIAEDFGAVRADVLEAAADRGRKVHAAIDSLHKYGGFPHEEFAHIDRYADWLSSSGFLHEASELVGYSERWGYAGTADLVGTIGTERWLIDIKTSAAVPRSVGPQTAAYAAMLPAPADRRGVLHLRPDGCRLISLDDRGDWGVFLSCLTIHRFLEAKP
jgi:hypothetical protein